VPSGAVAPPTVVPVTVVQLALSNVWLWSRRLVRDVGLITDPFSQPPTMVNVDPAAGYTGINCRTGPENTSGPPSPWDAYPMVYFFPFLPFFFPQPMAIPPSRD
jgi:hypothetical protein